MKHQPILKLSWAYIEIKIERERLRYLQIYKFNYTNDDMN